MHYLRATHAPLPISGAAGMAELPPSGATLALEDGLLVTGAETPVVAYMPPAAVGVALEAERSPLVAAGKPPIVALRMLPVGMLPAPLPGLLVGQFTGLRACSGMRISRKCGGTAASSTPEKLNSGGMGAPSGKRRPGSRRSSKYGCAHASIADRRLSGSYVSRLAMRSIAPNGARFLNTCSREEGGASEGSMHVPHSSSA